jgi:transcriptional regulator with XRE-family HTH domain
MGLSQDQLAKRAGVPQNAISRIERGERKPRRGTLERLARALGVESPSSLVLDLTPTQTFDDIIDGTPGQRQAYIEFMWATGRLDSFIENLEEIYEASMEDCCRDALTRARVQAGFMLGYVKGLQEGGVVRGEVSSRQ